RVAERSLAPDTPARGGRGAVAPLPRGDGAHAAAGRRGSRVARARRGDSPGARRDAARDGRAGAVLLRGARGVRPSGGGEAPDAGEPAAAGAPRAAAPGGGIVGRGDAR